jgi:hypothetical protein
MLLKNAIGFFFVGQVVIDLKDITKDGKERTHEHHLKPRPEAATGSALDKVQGKIKFVTKVYYSITCSTKLLISIFFAYCFWKIVQGVREKANRGGESRSIGQSRGFT